MIANLKHAARNGETVTIGGGQFGPAELLAAAKLLETVPELLEALRNIEVVLRDNKLASVGNSTIHYALYQARNAIAQGS